MLNVYQIIKTIYVNGQKFGIATNEGYTMTDNEPKVKNDIINWDNVIDNKNKIKDFYTSVRIEKYSNYKTLILIDYSKSIFAPAVLKIKEKNSPLEIKIETSYRLSKVTSLETIIKWPNIDQAIQYLKERGLSISMNEK